MRAAGFARGSVGADDDRRPGRGDDGSVRESGWDTHWLLNAGDRLAGGHRGEQDIVDIEGSGA